MRTDRIHKSHLHSTNTGRDCGVKMGITWKEIKKRGSQHYKKGTNLIEPIDLYKNGGMLRDFALASIIKYAYRNRTETGKPVNVDDMEKIKHYVDMLLAV